MGKLGSINGLNMPLWFLDLEVQDIATANYAPTDVEYLQNGFAVKNAGADDGYVYAISWWEYFKNGKSTTGLTPVKMYASAGDWILTPVVKCYAGNDGTYPSTATTLQIGLIDG